MAPTVSWGVLIQLWMIQQQKWRLAADCTASVLQLFGLVSSRIWRFAELNILYFWWVELMSDISPNIVEWIFVVCCSHCGHWQLLLFSLSSLTADYCCFCFRWYIHCTCCFSCCCLHYLCICQLLFLSFVVDFIEFVFVCGFVVFWRSIFRHWLLLWSLLPSKWFDSLMALVELP